MAKQLLISLLSFIICQIVFTPVSFAGSFYDYCQVDGAVPDPIPKVVFYRYSDVSLYTYGVSGTTSLDSSHNSSGAVDSGESLELINGDWYITFSFSLPSNFGDIQSAGWHFIPRVRVNFSENPDSSQDPAADINSTSYEGIAAICDTDQTGWSNDAALWSYPYSGKYSYRWAVRIKIPFDQSRVNEKVWIHFDAYAINNSEGQARLAMRSFKDYDFVLSDTVAPPPATPTEPPAPTATPTNTPTWTPTTTPTFTPTATQTPVPPPPTDTPVPPTNTPVPLADVMLYSVSGETDFVGVNHTDVPYVVTVKNVGETTINNAFYVYGWFEGGVKDSHVVNIEGGFAPGNTLTTTLYLDLNFVGYSGIYSILFDHDYSDNNLNNNYWNHQITITAPTPTKTFTPTATHTFTPSPSPSPTPPGATYTPTDTPTFTPTATYTPIPPTATDTPVPPATATQTPTYEIPPIEEPPYDLRGEWVYDYRGNTYVIGNWVKLWFRVRNVGLAPVNPYSDIMFKGRILDATGSTKEEEISYLSFILYPNSSKVANIYTKFSGYPPGYYQLETEHYWDTGIDENTGNDYELQQWIQLVNPTPTPTPSNTPTLTPTPTNTPTPTANPDLDIGITNVTFSGDRYALSSINGTFTVTLSNLGTSDTHQFYEITARLYGETINDPAIDYVYGIDAGESGSCDIDVVWSTVNLEPGAYTINFSIDLYDANLANNSYDYELELIPPVLETANIYLIRQSTPYKLVVDSPAPTNTPTVTPTPTAQNFTLNPSDYRVRLKFDDIDGATMEDSSGNGFHGFSDSMPSLTREGKYGGAVVLNASNSEYVQISPSGVTNAHSVGAWIKLNALYDYNILFSVGDSHGIYVAVDAGGDIVLRSRAGNTEYIGTKDTNLQAGVWYHIFYTYFGNTDPEWDTSYLYVYLNGSSIGGLGDQPGRWLSSYFYIGRGYWNVTTDTFHGVIDDYVFYRYELTSTQIGNLYSSYP